MQGTTDKQGWIRWVANCLQLPGYFLLIHNTFEVGLAIKAVSDLLLIVWGVRNKLWDVVMVTGIFCLMNLERLCELMRAHSWLQSVEESIRQLM